MTGQTGLCRGHAKLDSRGGRDLGQPPHGCLSPGQEGTQPRGSSGQGSSVVSAQASLPRTRSSVRDGHSSSTLVFTLVFPVLD